MNDAERLMAAFDQDIIDRYVRCQCCQTPVAEIRGSTLRIVARHHGQKHASVFTRADLEEFLILMGHASTQGDIAESGAVGYTEGQDT